MKTCKRHSVLEVQSLLVQSLLSSEFAEFRDCSPSFLSSEFALKSLPSLEFALIVC